MDVLVIHQSLSLYTWKSYHKISYCQLIVFKKSANLTLNWYFSLSFTKLSNSVLTELCTNSSPHWQRLIFASLHIDVQLSRTWYLYHYINELLHHHTSSSAHIWVLPLPYPIGPNSLYYDTAKVTTGYIIAHTKYCLVNVRVDLAPGGGGHLPMISTGRTFIREHVPPPP